MKRRRNWLIWVGLVVAIVAAVSYIPVFSLFPSTRDTAWANLALFGVAFVLLGVGVYRPFAKPQLYRGKISGSIASVVTVLLFSLFVWGIFFGSRVPTSADALRAGAQAPEFALRDTANKPVRLADLRASSRAVLVIFYRGYW
jgi:hypothetical protein